MEIPWAAICPPSSVVAAAIWTAVFFAEAARAIDPIGHHPWAKAIDGLWRAVAAVLDALAVVAADYLSLDAEEGVSAEVEKRMESGRDLRLLFSHC